MSSTIWQRLNRHITKFPFVLIEQKEGKVYLLEEHWKYLNPYQDAKRALLGTGKISNDRFEYLNDLFPILKRTKWQP